MSDPRPSVGATGLSSSSSNAGASIRLRVAMLAVVAALGPAIALVCSAHLAGALPWLLATLVMGLVVGTLAYRLIQSINASVARVAVTLQHQALGNESARAHMSGGDELAALGRQFDLLLDQYQRRRDRLSSVEDEAQQQALQAVKQSYAMTLDRLAMAAREVNVSGNALCANAQAALSFATEARGLVASADTNSGDAWAQLRQQLESICQELQQQTGGIYDLLDQSEKMIAVAGHQRQALVPRQERDTGQPPPMALAS